VIHLELAIASHFRPLIVQSTYKRNELAYRELDGFGDGLEERRRDASEVLAGVVTGGDGKLGKPPEPGLPTRGSLLGGGLAEQLLVAPLQPLLLGWVPPLTRALRATHHGAAPAPAWPLEGGCRDE
jgi:hypothetical protein